MEVRIKRHLTGNGIDWKVGKIVDVTPGEAKAMVRVGYGEYVHAGSEAVVETAMLEAAPARRVTRTKARRRGGQ